MAVLLSTYRDRVKLHENGYLYVFDKMSSNGEKKFWRCERKSECNARVHTDAVTNQVVKRSSMHNHPSNPYIVQRCGIRALVNRHSKESIGESSKSLSQQAHFVNEELQQQQQEKVSPSNTDALEAILQQTQRNLADENGLITLSSTNEKSGGPSRKRRKDLGKTSNRDANKSQSFYKSRNAFASSSVSEVASVKKEIAGQVNDIRGSIMSDVMEQVPSSIETVRSQSPLNKRSFRNSSTYKCIEKFLTGGLITWCPKISEITDLGELLVKMISHSDTKTYASLLLTGAANAGKTCLAALIAKHSEIPALRLCSPDDLVGYSETAKVLAICKIFEDAYKSSISIIILDSVDRLVDYCAVRNHFSNLVLQTLYVLLKKAPPPGHRLLVIGTSEESCANAFELKTHFSFSVEVPCLTEISHLMAVIEGCDAFDVSQRELLRQLLEEYRSKLSIGIKRLLDMLELAKQCDPLQRVAFLYQKLKDFVSL